MTKLIFAALLSATFAAAHAVSVKNPTLCGEKSGGALIDRNKKAVVTFTEETFAQANEQVKGSMQEGVQYCAVVKLAADGKPEKILKINRRHK